MMKRFTFLLTLLLLFTTNLCAQDNTEFTVSYGSGDYAYGLGYKIISETNRTCTLLGFSSAPQSAIELSIPEKASYGEKEYSVTAIADNAFSDFFTQAIWLEGTLTIPATVVTIGEHAFEFLNTKLIILYEGNEMVIGNGAFAYAGEKFTTLICKAATPPTVGETNPFVRHMHIFVNDPEAYKTAWGLAQGQNYPYYKQLIDNKEVEYDNYSLVFNYNNTNYESLNVKLGDAPTAPCSLTIPSKIVISGTSFNVTAIAADGFANEYCSYFTNVLSDSETAPTLLGENALSGFNQTNKPTLYVRGKLNDDNSLIIDESYNSWRAYFNEIKNASVKEDYPDYKYSIVYSITDLNNKKCAINKFICGNESVSYPLNLKNTVKILEEDYTITTIEDLEEGERGQFNEINFPYNSSISYIGNNAFSSSTLKELFLPESISYIGYSAFKFASSSSKDKTKLIIYGENTTISENIFYNSPSGIYVSSQYYVKYIENPYKNITHFMPYYSVDSKGTGSWKMYNKDNSSLENITDITDMNVVISAHYEITNNVFDVASYYVMNNESASLTLDMDNGQLISGSRYGKDIKITKSITGFGSDNNTKSGWYTISSPLNTNVAVTDVENLLDNTYDLYSYVEEYNYWLNYKQGEGFNELEVGHGYLYANSDDTELTFTGIENTKDVNIGPLTFTSTSGALAGIHLIGNPFTHDIYKSEKQLAAINNTSLATGYYVLGNAGEWTARTNTQAIKAGEGFLTKANAGIENLTIKKNNQAVTAKSSQDAMLKIDLSGKDYQDVAYVTFSEAIGLDKINHRNENIPMVYIPIDGINYAIASVDSEIKEIPLCVEVKNMGEYTIGIKAQDCTLEDIILVDLLTGKETNMLTDTYSFIAKSNDNPNRFMIRLDNSQGTSDNSHFIYISNEELIINDIEGQGFIQIYDILGRPVAEYNVSSSANIPTASFSDGVYVVRMIDENGIKVQKVIID
ncbi:MAG: T9SS type A sorting domain-containing protein [Lentimicrobiaceae bacterium]|nr:T9SS type A sorting domain-containing protein [Lentimicrobiaceae bacterium]